MTTETRADASKVAVDELAREAAATAVGAAEATTAAGQPPREITLSNGIRLRLLSVPPFALRQVAISVPEPEVPKFLNEAKGREEENPNHPDYIKALKERDDAVYLAAVQVSLIMGIEVVGVPDDWIGIEDDGWIEQLEAAGIEVDVENTARRKLAWLQLYAMRTPADISNVTAFVLAGAGLMESEVMATLSSFLGAEERGADREGSTDGDGDDGDHVSADGPGSGAGDRGA